MRLTDYFQSFPVKQILLRKTFRSSVLNSCERRDIELENEIWMSFVINNINFICKLFRREYRTIKRYTREEKP